MGEPVLHDYALLPQPETESRVEIAADRASIAVGDLRAEVRFCADRPDRLTVSYYNQRGELLLAERGGTDALKIRPRRFRPLPGGACQLLVQFEAQAAEKLYGMGPVSAGDAQLQGQLLRAGAAQFPGERALRALQPRLRLPLHNPPSAAPPSART